MIEAKRQGALKALAALDRELARRPFIVGDDYTIAGPSAVRDTRTSARDADLPLGNYRNVIAWIGPCTQSARAFSIACIPIRSISHSSNELP